MAQRKWFTELADQFEGGVSTEKAILDISRGIIDNLIHECWGLYGTASPKHTQGVNFVKTGIVAFDRVKFLPWKSYEKIARGEDVIVPHTGNLDTVQWPVRRKWVNSYEFMATDLARLRNEPLYRAKMVASMTQTLGSSFDCELFELLIATSMAQKNATIEAEFPKRFDPLKIDIYMQIANLVTELETKISAYYMGVQRKEIQMLVDPKLYNFLIRALSGGSMAHFEKQLTMLQSESINPEIISGIRIVRHIALNNFITNEATNDIKTYNFKGIRAIIYHVATPWLVQNFQETNGVINKDTGNYRMIMRIMWDKGLIYHDLIRMVKDASTEEKPLEVEKNIIAYRNEYNRWFEQYIYEVEDLDDKEENERRQILKAYNLSIPSNLKDLRKNYRQEILKEE